MGYYTNKLWFSGQPLTNREIVHLMRELSRRFEVEDLYCGYVTRLDFFVRKGQRHYALIMTESGNSPRWVSTLAVFNATARELYIPRLHNFDVSRPSKVRLADLLITGSFRLLLSSDVNVIPSSLTLEEQETFIKNAYKWKQSSGYVDYYERIKPFQIRTT